MSALAKIQDAGFQVAVVNGNLTVAPASKLTTTQREFLKQHKAEIIEEIERDALPITPPDSLMVTLYTPDGTPVTTLARDADHAAWMQRMNPRPAINPALFTEQDGEK